MAGSGAFGITTSMPSTSSAIVEQSVFCRVCQKQYAKYTCPRCNLRYCGLQCYKAHSLRCTESFNRENCLAEMKDLRVTEENKRKMVESLKRIHFDEEGRSILDDLEDADEMDDRDTAGAHIWRLILLPCSMYLGFRLAAVALKICSVMNDFVGCELVSADRLLSEETIQRLSAGGDYSLEHLSAEERKAFLRAVAAGELSHMIIPWEPWWYNPAARTITLTKHGTRRVQILDEEEGDDSEAAVAEIPAPPDKPLPPVSQLTPVEPSPLLAYHLAEILYSYCFTVRLFNGDWQSDALDAASTLLSISEVLGESFAPESVSTALTACLEKICSPVFRHTGGYRFGVGLFDDTSALLKTGKAGVICALADLQRLLGAALRESKGGQATEKQGGRAAPRRHSPTTDAVVEDIRAATFQGISRSGRSQRDSSLCKRLHSACRKIYFLTCWVNEQEGAVVSSLVILVDDEKRRLPVEPSSQLGGRN